MPGYRIIVKHENFTEVVKKVFRFTPLDGRPGGAVTYGITQAALREGTGN